VPNSQRPWPAHLVDVWHSRDPQLPASNRRGGIGRGFTQMNAGQMGRPSICNPEFTASKLKGQEGGLAPALS